MRKEQAERQRRFYEKIKLEKKIEQFKKEALEIQNLEKFVLNQEKRKLFRSTRENRENKTKISSYSRTKN